MFHGRIIREFSTIGCGLLAAAAVAITSAGCQQFATYPPVEVTARLQRPAAEPVPTIIAEATRYARERYLSGENLPINLPENVPAMVYDRVFLHLSDPAPGVAANAGPDNTVISSAGRPMLIPGERAIHFIEIRTRAMNAQVDMIYPGQNGFYQLVTLTLERSVLDPWRVKSERRWVTRNLQPPPPYYVAPPPMESAANDQPKPLTVRAVQR